MPLQLKQQKLLSARSERAKAVDFHPTEQVLLAALYSGSVMLWNYASQSLLNQAEVSSVPVRTARFMPQCQMIVCADDLMNVILLNQHTLAPLRTIAKAHADFIRCVLPHPQLPVFLTCSDDMTVKLWHAQRSASEGAVATFEGHSHYAMCAAWNPQDGQQFATASLDKSIKVWGLPPGSLERSSTAPRSAHYTLLGHDGGVNCVDYIPGGGRPYMASGGDDHMVKIWDYQTKQCLQTLSGHTDNVMTVRFHPLLPVILSGSEDGDVRVWHSGTYRLEQTISNGLDRCWSIAVRSHGSHDVAFGHDEGCVVIKLGSEAPVVSMSSVGASGRVVWCAGCSSVVHTASLRQALQEAGDGYVDGERLPVVPRDLGRAELFPQSCAYHPNGRLMAFCGDGEYVVYTAQALRNKAFGPARAFAWSATGHYAVRDSSNNVAVFHDFQQAFVFKPPIEVEALFGGELLGVSNGECVCFYDWDHYRLVRRIDIACQQVVWSKDSASSDAIGDDDFGDDFGEEFGEADATAGGTRHVALCCADGTFLMQVDLDAVHSGAGSNAEDQLEESFLLTAELSERACSGLWVRGSFFFVTSANHVCLATPHGEVDTLYHLAARSGGPAAGGEGGDASFTLCGYLPSEGSSGSQAKLVVCDRSLNFYCYGFSLAYLRWLSALAQPESVPAAMDAALRDGLLTALPAGTPATVLSGEELALRGRMVKLLETRGHLREALQVAATLESRMRLALGTGDLVSALQFLGSERAALTARGFSLLDSQQQAVQLRVQFKALGDAALDAAEFELAENCYRDAGDCSGLLLLASAGGDALLAREAADMARSAILATTTTAAHTRELANVAVTGYMLLKDVRAACSAFLSAGQVVEAAVLARTYAPSLLTDKELDLVGRWSRLLAEGGSSKITVAMAEALAAPGDACFADAAQWAAALEKEAQTLGALAVVEGAGKEVPAEAPTAEEPAAAEGTPADAEPADAEPADPASAAEMPI